MSSKQTEKWDSKLIEMIKQYPRLDNLNWADILREDPDMFQNVIGGIVRPKKGKMSIREGDTKLARLSNTDYSELDFPTTVQILCQGVTIREMAQKLGYTTPTFYNLSRGKRTPTALDMERIAEFFGRKPTLFKEYRLGKILGSILTFIEQNPETAMVWFAKILKAEGIKIK